jgi:hypothetical protein
MTSNLGPMPDPEIDPKEPNPGGVDRIDTNEFPTVVNELDPDVNPAIEDAAPDELKQPEESQDGPHSDGASNPEEEDQV